MKPQLSWVFLAHLIATNDVRVAATRSARAHGWAVDVWRGEHLLAAQHQKQPLAGVPLVVPDAYFHLSASQDRYNFFVEVDRATVTVDGTAGERNWKQKVQNYRSYYASGQYERAYGTRDLRILVVTTSERRLAHLKAVTERTVDSRRLWFVTHAALQETDMLMEPFWQVAGYDGRFALIYDARQ